ncbi:hypothetical protein BGZ63DRAFT_349992 [Mariannaea sp. PMI_226]|nr:hypothetical protein BGZ63DRAFT_349992 [Mariannaea sp. PMI_226]
MNSSPGKEVQTGGQSHEKPVSSPTSRHNSNPPITDGPKGQSGADSTPSSPKPAIYPVRCSSATGASDDNIISREEMSFSPWSASSDKQFAHQSTSSEISGDRVFPIRSVISVEPTSNQITSQEHGNPDAEVQNNPDQLAQLPRASRHDLMPHKKASEIRPAITNPKTSSDGYFAAVTRRRNTPSGPMSSIQLDAARHGSSPIPLQLDIAVSDRESEGSVSRSETSVAHDVHGKSPKVSSGHSIDDEHVTTRFTHVVTEEGHAVITGRDGVLQRCEDEPIHTPGAVQIFGALLAMREEVEGCFVVRYVSENSERLLGYAPHELFQLTNFLDILTEEQQDNLLDHIDFIRDEDADPATNGPEVFGMSIKLPKSRSIKLWCAIHINPAHPDLIICEFELDNDVQYPLRPPDETTPGVPYDTLQSNPTLEDIEESTEIYSKPLRVLRSARKRRGEQGAMQVFDVMSQVQEQLASAPNLETFLKILVGIVKELTGFHRIMIYQFDSSFNGKVVTELVETSQTRDLYKGLHFPASDIPRQARDLYKLNKVRILYDRDQETSRIVCRTKEDLDVPLDMSHAYLRAMSPIHLKYLANMEVRSSMSISIDSFNELWGLISCHSYGSQGMRVSFPIRKMCRLVGDTASRNIERLSYAMRLQARKLINTAPTEKNPAGYIIASSEDLLNLFDADFGLLSINEETKILGSIEESQEALVMLEYLRMRKLTSVVASQDINKDFPDLRYTPGFQVIAGMLYVPLSVGGNDFIVCFRRGQVKEVKWAGNPYAKIIREGTTGYLEPRTSFKTWHETVLGSCREWTEEQIETAAVLCLVYGKFIEVWRQKEAALQSSSLTRLLLANSAHEVRTPLNAIINYLEIALEGKLDQETRENLARSHSASKSLIYVINDLLDLTKTEEGQNLINNEVFELSKCIRDATEPFKVKATRKGIQYRVIEHPGLPWLVHGDERRVRQAISNIAANAITHTSIGHVSVEALVTDVRDRHVIIDFVVEDTGSGMSTRQIDALFRDLEQVGTQESSLSSSQFGEDRTDFRTLGLGLALVSRIVRNMNGQLRLKSEADQGSRFVIQLPFLIPNDQSKSEIEQGDNAHSNATSVSKPIVPVPRSLTATPEGEIMLVNRASVASLIDEAQAQAQQADSRSPKSDGSKHQVHSGIERLTDMIEPQLSFDSNELDYSSLEPHTHSKDTSTPNLPILLRVGEESLPGSEQLPPASADQQLHSPTEPGNAGVCYPKIHPEAPMISEEHISVSQLTKNIGGFQSVEIPSDLDSLQREAATNSVTSGGTQATDQIPLRVLVAEDDPINIKILRKRLERAGHNVRHTVNGEDCATVYRENPTAFDVVLMDMQMPIVDGLTSTKMIREIEKSSAQTDHPSPTSSNHRVPIFAVSASLQENEKHVYIDAGFDGWILKPIDFKRLSTFLLGILDDDVRASCVYVPGEWERGGWFKSQAEQGSPKH